MRPIIGVLPLFNAENDNLWINPGYTDGIEAAGGFPVLLQLSGDAELWEQACRCCDGFLFTGGQDVDPALYGEETIPECEYTAPRRDRQEIWMLRRLLELDRPVLGICRGAQLINVAAGGTMYQDLPVQLGGEVAHRPAVKGSKDYPFHSVKIAENSVLYPVYGPELVVNSIHHQGIKDPGRDVFVSASAPDGLAEAVEINGKRFVLGVQWHPEMLWRERAEFLEIFRLLVDACR